MFKKIVTGLVAAGIVAGSMLAATSADAKPYWKYHPHYYGYNHGYNYGGYGYDNGGGAIAAGILGFIGGTIFSQLGHPSYGYGGYCETHFRTYSSTTHSYMGYDGKPHPCFD